MNSSFSDRIFSILSYFTFGMFGLICIIYSAATKRRLSSFLAFNVYQAIFLSVCFAILSFLYSIAINLISVIPFVGKLAILFDNFFNQTPLYFTFTISGLLVTLIVMYLSIISLLGKKPQLPLISDIVSANFGG